jgi:hypothetical protein
MVNGALVITRTPGKPIGVMRVARLPPPSAAVISAAAEQQHEQDDNQDGCHG